MVSITLQVRFYETDMMKVAHHTNHIRWFEMGRIAYFREAGISLWDIMDSGIVFPITRISCEYKHAAHFDDVLVVETRIKSYSKAQSTFSYTIRRESNGDIIATGETQNVFTSKETGKIVRMPEEFFSKLRALAEDDLNNE